MTPSAVAFRVQATHGQARAGAMSTPHGEVPTPAFMPVASQASVKALTPQEVRATGAHILLANTYHLYLRPGVEIVEELGGLHAFMGWDGPILTDSGGFQAYSLGPLRRITEDGIVFTSHIDGSQHRFFPEDAVRHQEALGADIVMALDQCIAYGAEDEEVRGAMERTHRWARRCREVHRSGSQALFGIVQGGHDPALREESAAFVTGLDFDGYAAGGLGVGEPKEVLYRLAAYTAPLLPPDRPRYLMGVGSPEDLVEAVAFGYDLFDCALPTRVARTGAFYRADGRHDVTVACFRHEDGPLEADCDCATCQTFTAAYIHHLFRARELLAYRLTTVHNLRFYQRLMARLRESILDGSFDALRQAFHRAYTPANEEARLGQREQWLEARERNRGRQKAGG